MNWINSTNAKEIGTLYLIFAVFAGMIGTAHAFIMIFFIILWLPLLEVLLVLIFYPSKI